MSERINELQYRVLVSAGLIMLALILVRARFCGEPDLPEPPEKTVVEDTEEQRQARQLETDQETYQRYLLQDSRGYQVAPPATLASMKRPFAYVSVSEPKTLTVGEELSLGGLKLRLVVDESSKSPRRLMVLEIENTRTRPLAYKIVTQPSGGSKLCKQKVNLPHNAIAVLPGKIVRRSECLYVDGAFLQIQSLETLEVPELSYHYLMAIKPERFGLPSRTRKGHETGTNRQPCKLLHSARVEGGIESGVIRWRDLLEFYARHRCQTYKFVENFQSFTGRADEVLPVIAK